MGIDNIIDAVEVQLAEKFGKEVEVINFNPVASTLEFSVNSNDVWVNGYVKIDQDTDLAVYLEWPDKYEYQFDILWCDILPEEDNSEVPELISCTECDGTGFTEDDEKCDHCWGTGLITEGEEVI